MSKQTSHPSGCVDQYQCFNLILSCGIVEAVLNQVGVHTWKKIVTLIRDFFICFLREVKILAGQELCLLSSV